jgi:hypothetical protein
MTWHVASNVATATTSHPSDPAALRSFSAASPRQMSVLITLYSHCVDIMISLPRRDDRSMPAIAVFPNQFHAVRHRRQRIDQRAKLLAMASHAAPAASLRRGQFRLMDATGLQANRHLISMVPIWNRILRPCPGLPQPGIRSRRLAPWATFFRPSGLDRYLRLSPPSTASVCPVTKLDAFRK